MGKQEGNVASPGPPPAGTPAVTPPDSSCVDWYAAGETRVVEVAGVRVVVRFIGRKGRRGRIAITAPAGAIFHAMERGTDT
jgi:hypothetical protein